MYPYSLIVNLLINLLEYTFRIPSPPSQTQKKKNIYPFFTPSYNFIVRWIIAIKRSYCSAARGFWPFPNLQYPKPEDEEGRAGQSKALNCIPAHKIITTTTTSSARKAAMHRILSLASRPFGLIKYVCFNYCLKAYIFSFKFFFLHRSIFLRMLCCCSRLPTRLSVLINLHTGWNTINVMWSTILISWLCFIVFLIGLSIRFAGLLLEH